MRHPEDFSYTYYHYLTQPIEYWASELAWELHNAGLKDGSFRELRIEYVDDYLQQFPEELKGDPMTFLRSKAEALWALGRQEEAEAQFAAIIKNYPDNPWGYIGWSDHYVDYRASTVEYPKAERILLQALAHPNLEDRRDVFKRLYDLYETWGEEEKADGIIEQVANEPDPKPKKISRSKYGLNPPPIPDDLIYADYEYDEKEDKYESETVRHLGPKPGRNEPCWCGSGKKYKKCHWRQDRS